MADQQKTASDLKSEGVSKSTGDELDRTRRDIDGDKPGMNEATRTSIRIEGVTLHPDDQPKKKRLFSLPRFKRKDKKSDALPAKVRVLPVSLQRYAGIWVARPDLPFIQRLVFGFSRLLIFSGSIALFVLLFQGALHSIEISSHTPWLVLGILGGTVALSLLSFFFLWPAPWFFGFPLIAILFLLLYHIFFFPLTDPSFFTILGKAPAFILNHVWLTLLGLELVLILFVYPRLTGLKIFLILLVLYGFAGFAVNRLEGVALEAAWQGTGIFASIPLVFAQPVFVTLQFVVPFFLLISLGSFFSKSHLQSGRSFGWIGLNIVVLILSGTFGWWLLHQNRIPNLLTLFLNEPLGLGVAQYDFNGQKLELKTSNFEVYKDQDTLERYRMELTESPSKKDFFVSVYDLDNYPVLFLSETDLELTIDGAKSSKWKLETLTSADRPKQKKGLRHPPLYRLSVTMPKPAPIFEIDLPDAGPVYTPDDSVRFSLSDKSPPLVSYEIFIDGKSVGKKEVPEGERSFLHPLAGVEAGKHFFEIVGMGTDGRELKRTQEIMIQPFISLAIESPMEGDFFQDTLSVFARISTAGEKQVQDVRFYLDDQEKAQKTVPPYSALLDTHDLSPGTHALKIEVRPVTGEPLSQTVTVIKGSYPEIAFVRPSLGEYVSIENRVEVSAGDGGYETLTLFLNGEKIHEWVKAAPPYQYQWDTTELSSDDYVLKVQGKSASGMQSSDWVQVSMGQASLSIVPPEGAVKGKGVLEYQEVVFVIDASISQWDNWEGKPKWEWAKQLFGISSIEKKLGGSEVGIVLFGSKSPYYQNDCSDSHWLIEPGRFNDKKISESFKNQKPTGVSALFDGIRLALGKKPQKIIVITDGADSCSRQVPAKLKTDIQKGGMILDVVTFGTMPETEAKILGELAEAGSGHLVMASNGKELEEKMVQILTRYFHLLKGEKVLLSAPVDGKPRPLRPGEYLLKLSMNPPFADRPVLLKNGLTTEVKLRINGDKTEADETSFPF